jgi:hypothetical protein
MIVKLEKSIPSFSRLVMRVRGGQVEISESGRGRPTTKSLATRTEAIAFVEKTTARRQRYGWTLESRTEEDHYLLGLDRVQSICSNVRAASGFSNVRTRVLVYHPASRRDLDGDGIHAGLVEVRHFFFTTQSAWYEFALTVGSSTEYVALCFGKGATKERGEFEREHNSDRRRCIGDSLGRFAMLDLAAGKIFVVDDRGREESSFADFRAWFDQELRELPQYLFDAAGRLGVALSLAP